MNNNHSFYNPVKKEFLEASTANVLEIVPNRAMAASIGDPLDRLLPSRPTFLKFPLLPSRHAVSRLSHRSLEGCLLIFSYILSARTLTALNALPVLNTLIVYIYSLYSLNYKQHCSIFRRHAVQNSMHSL